MDDIQVRVTHGTTVTIAEIDLGIGIMVIGEAKLHPNDKVYDPVIGSSYALGRAMTNAGTYLTKVAAELVDANEVGCQCLACQLVKHASDCALHGTDVGIFGEPEISYEGPCDCGGTYSVESDEGSTGQIPHDLDQAHAVQMDQTYAEFDAEPLRLRKHRRMTGFWNLLKKLRS